MSWFKKKTPSSEKTVQQTAVQTSAPNVNTVNSAKPKANWSPTMATTAGLTVEEGLTSIAETAGMAFAGGNYDEAQAILTQHLNETKGATEKIIWHLLIDLYQIQKSKPQFEKVADFYAKKFNTSPPSWKETEDENKNVFSGRNVMVLDGILRQEIEDKVKDFLKITKTQKVCKIECSRVDIERSEIVGLTLWLETMRQVRKFQAQATLMGETGIVAQLTQKIDAVRDGASQMDQIYWLLKLELLQWQGKEAEFEDLAFEFASTYDVSPPGYDASGVMQIEAGISDAHDARLPPKAPAILTEGALNTWMDAIDKWAANNEEGAIEVHFGHVERISFEAVGFWSSWAHQNQKTAKRLRVIQANNWVVVLMNMVNLLQTIKVINKVS
jgi:ABC-type transporter Mla MlaB component